MGQCGTSFTPGVSKNLNNNYFSVIYFKGTALLLHLKKNIGYGRHVEQRDVLPHKSLAVDQNLLIAEDFLKFYHAPSSE